MVAFQTEDGNFLFRHVCGLLRVILKDIPDEAARFVVASEGTDAPALSGMAEVADITLSSPAAMLADTGGHQVTYQLPDSPAEELTFYIPLPVGVYPRLTVSLQRANGEAYFTRTLSNVEARHAVLLDVPVVNAATGGCYSLTPQAKEITEEEGENFSVLSTSEDGIVVLHYVGDTMSPQIGDVLIQGGDGFFPEGFLGKVVDIEQHEDGSCTLTTLPASWSDVLTDLYVNTPIDLIPQQADTRAIGHISSERDEDGYRCFTIGVSDISSEENMVSLEGDLTIGLRFIPTISLKDGAIQHAVFTLESKMLADYTVSLAGVVVAFERRLPIGKPIPLGSYNIPNTTRWQN